MALFSGEQIACVRGERAIFAGLSFALERGGALLLTGPNGSGKSSLLRLMAGLLPPAAGCLLWDGVPVADDPPAHRERLQFISHQDALKPVLTAAENLGFWAGMRGGSAVAVAMQGLGIDHLAGTPGRFLSAGQKRRVNLARLLASPASLWLLDEPTTGLDHSSVAAFEAALARHRQAGGIVVASTHTPLDLPGAATLRLDDYPVAPLFA